MSRQCTTERRRSIQPRLPVDQHVDAIVAARRRSRTQHHEALAVTDGLPIGRAIVGTASPESEDRLRLAGLDSAACNLQFHRQQLVVR